MKATHSGTCQLCGRRHLLPGGRLAKHGYTVEWGFFSGTCPGSGELPFEQSIDLIADRIIWAQEAAKNLRRSAAGAEGTRMNVHVFEDGVRIKGRSSGEWRELARCAITFHGEFSGVRIEWVGRDGRLRSQWTGTEYAHDEERAVTVLNSKYAAHLRYRAKGCQSYADSLIERAANWKPHPEKLVPVTKERDGPLIHYLGGYGKLCAGSYKGARRGYSTADVAHVTCQKCKAHTKFPAQPAH